MSLWVAPVLLLALLAVARWAKVREDRAREWRRRHGG
jgi:hypothetical protein